MSANPHPAALPLTKISIFSSGIAYFEHSGELNDPTIINLPFKEDVVNDALKSLVLNDPASANPSVSYQSSQTLLQTLRSLKIDLSDNLDIAGILSKLRGAEVEAAVPTPVSGRIVGVEYRPISVSKSGEHINEPWLSLYTEEGIKMFSLAEVNSLHFKNPQLAQDLQRALDLIAASRNSNLRDLTINLPGAGNRKVSVSYVIPAPVWKVSYRLDLGKGDGAIPLFQGWAIVDNDSDSDWDNVKLSLVAGKPVSFIQNLYPPYYLSRPVIPLAIAAAAAPETHDAGYMPKPQARQRMAAMAKQSMPDMKLACEVSEMDAPVDSFVEESVRGGVIETASGAAAGDQFEFTIKNPVSLDRRMSAMLPLVESYIHARKLLIFSGGSAGPQNRNPRLGAELSNTSGMKLPAGPITVYDGGTYAGDALIEFWNEGEKRLISFGADLSVTGALMESRSSTLTVVTITGGTLIFNRKQEYASVYTFKNTAAAKKQLIIEHPKTSGATLDSPEADEQTPSAYRISVTLPAENQLEAVIRESRPAMEHVSLLKLGEDSLLSYASNKEIPPKAREALREAGKLRASVSDAESAVKKAESRRDNLVKDQERIRKNLEAAGGQTAQGQEYLKKLTSLDNNIDTVAREIEKLNEYAQKARKACDDYIKELSLQIAVTPTAPNPTTTPNPPTDEG